MTSSFKSFLEAAQSFELNKVHITSALSNTNVYVVVRFNSCTLKTKKNGVGFTEDYFHS